jgi:hypothetical protein
VLYITQTVQTPLHVVDPQDHGSLVCGASNHTLKKDVSLGRVHEANSAQPSSSLFRREGLDQLRERLSVFLSFLVVSEVRGDARDHVFTTKILASQLSGDQRGYTVTGSRKSSVDGGHHLRGSHLLRALTEPGREPALPTPGGTLEQDQSPSSTSADLTQRSPQDVTFGLSIDHGDRPEAIQGQAGVHQVHRGQGDLCGSPVTGHGRRWQTGGARHGSRSFTGGLRVQDQGHGLGRLDLRPVGQLAQIDGLADDLTELAERPRGVRGRSESVGRIFLQERLDPALESSGNRVGRSEGGNGIIEVSADDVLEAIGALTTEG